MKKESQSKGGIFSNKIICFMIMCIVLSIVPMSSARENADNSAFPGMNGISTKSSAMFYNDNNSGNGKSPALFTGGVGHKLSDGIEVTAAGSQYPVRLIPVTMSQGTGRRNGNRITYQAAPGVHIIYTFKKNGIKEDIVLENASSAPLNIAFRLELDPMLQAQLDRKGNVLIYGPNSVLSGFIQAGDEKSAELVLKARRQAPKDNLLYIIPAPVVIDGKGKKHNDLAHYSLDRSILTVHADGLTNLSAPVSIDPSIVVTTTADFMTGNNEGMISFDTDAISRALPSGGSITNWTATTSFPTTRRGHTSVAYNGYLYVIGGVTGGSVYLNDVQFAPINANGTIGSWTATTGFTTARNYHSSVVYNGYLYVIGGYNGSYLNDVQFAPINANGTVGTWTTTTILPSARRLHRSVAYNGYLYVIGGYNGSYLNTIQFAPINANGTIGAWTATTSFTTARYSHTSVAYNGYLYVIGGWNGSYLNDVQFAPINANGTVGAWIATTILLNARQGHTSAAYNGYLYVIGGNSGAGFLNDVQYAPVNANGTVGAWTAVTSFAMARYNHSSVAYNGYLYVIGGYDGSLFNDVQFALINGNGTVSPWTATTSFSPPRNHHTSAAYNGYLYVIGGYHSFYGILNDVQFAPINADGTIGTWTVTTSFLSARYAHTSVAYNGYLYVIGGTGSGGLFYNDVQFAPINANGTLGAWTATTSFITARCYHASVSYNGYLYVIGGYNGSSPLNDVQFASFNANGTVGAWTATTSFATARIWHSSVASNGYLYVLGGWAGSSFLDNVQFAPINSNGTVGSWSATTSLTSARMGHTSESHNGYLYVLGGQNASGNLNEVQFAPINANGTIGAWTATTSFTTTRHWHTSEVYNGYLYIIGGFDDASYFDDVQFAPINGNRTFGVGAWTATTSFTTARIAHTSAAYNGYLYVLGGSNGTSFFNDVQFAPINADGTVGSWTATTSFTTGRNFHSSAAYNGYLYVIGGWSGSVLLSDVQFAPVNANGTVGTWTATTSLPAARDYQTTVAYNGYLYVIGGLGGSLLNDVQYAPINANGTIGAWIATTSFIMARRSHTSVAYNGYLYVIGGWNGTAELNDVQFAPINANGTLGAWTATTSFTTAREYHASVAYNGYLYVIGGYNNVSGNLSNVQYAPINANGTVGAWAAATSLSAVRDLHTSAAYNGYLYVLGGYGTSYLNDVQYAVINGPAARGHYSKLVDLGADQIVTSFQFSDSGAKGITNLIYTVAPSSTAVFGTRTSIANALSGTPYTTGLNTCGRYMWVNFDLDDTFSAIDGGGLNDRGDILDFTITYDLFTGVGASLRVSKSLSNIHLAWSASQGATSYNVLRCDAAMTPCTPVTIASPVTNAYDDPVLADSSNYWYLIQAVNGACVSP